MNTTVLSMIVNSDALPSMPAVAFWVLELAGKDDTDVADVADVIAKDPAMAARFMKVSNASMFGASKGITSVEQAIETLGLRTVQTLALGFSLVDAMNGTSSIGFDYRRYWCRSLSTAVAAWKLAEILGDVRRHEAFVGGLLCDMGIVAAERCAGRIYEPVIMRHARDGGRLQDIERALLGITHAQISGLLLAHWSMPELLSHAVSAHHGEGFERLGPRAKDLARILWASSEIGELFCGDMATAGFAQLRRRVIALTAIGEAALDAMLDQLPVSVREAAELFHVELACEGEFEFPPRQFLHGAYMIAQAWRQRRPAKADPSTTRATMRRAEAPVHPAADCPADAGRICGLVNRQEFEEWLRAAIDGATVANAQIGLILGDLDHFKKLNDTYGHMAGDRALHLVGRCLERVATSAYATARYGDKFAIVVTDVQAAAEKLRDLAEEIRRSIGRVRLNHGAVEVGVTASLGAARKDAQNAAVDGNSIIAAADKCLEAAKHAGRDRVTVQAPCRLPQHP